MKHDWIAGALLALAAQVAWAEDFRPLFPGVGLQALFTSDTVGFKSSQLRPGVLVDYKSADDYASVAVGGTRYRQDAWSADRYSLLGVMKKVERATGAGFHAGAGISNVGDRTRFIADATWNVRLSETTGVELIGHRDFIETRAGLDAGATANLIAASLDHAVTERFTVIGFAAAQQFSDDNLRGHLRGRLIYTLIPEQGLSVQLRARAYETSRRGSALYFSPEHYENADLGLRLRRSFGDWRVLAAAGAGKERIERSIENPTSYVEASAERRFSNSVSLALNFTAVRSSDSDNATTGRYTWRYLRAVAIIPF